MNENRASHQRAENAPLRPSSRPEYVTREICAARPRVALAPVRVVLEIVGGDSRQKRKGKRPHPKPTRTASRWSWIETFAPRVRSVGDPPELIP